MNPGFYKGKIKKNGLRITNTGTHYVFLEAEIDVEMVQISIWLTEKARGMARQQLKSCGFDVDTEDLLVLATDSIHLYDREIPIEVFEEEYNGKLQTKARIPTSQGDAVPVARVRELQRMLREAKRKQDVVPTQEEPPVGEPPPTLEDEDEIPF